MGVGVFMGSSEEGVASQGRRAEEYATSALNVLEEGPERWGIF